jgi:hypothetical protein
LNGSPTRLGSQDYLLSVLPALRCMTRNLPANGWFLRPVRPCR